MFVCLEDPNMARKENWQFDNLFQGMQSGSNVYLMCQKKMMKIPHTKFVTMVNQNQIWAGSHCVGCHQKAVVVTRFNGDKDLGGLQEITEHH